MIEHSKVTITVPGVAVPVHQLKLGDYFMLKHGGDGLFMCLNQYFCEGQTEVVNLVSRKISTLSHEDVLTAEVLLKDVDLTVKDPVC